jgi:putative CRISPR-associated protein (TIGR02619 family)
MKHFFLASVGTSLISNYNKKVEERGEENGIINLSILDENYGGESDSFPGHDDALKNSGKHGYYCEFWEKIIDHIKKELEDRKDIAMCCAEMSSLLSRDENFELNPDDRVLLVGTNTPEGHLCARAIRECIKMRWETIGESAWKDDIVRIKLDVEGLGNAFDEGFGALGLPSFISYVQEQISVQLKENYEVVLLPTGGYKALIPYMVIAGILENVPNRYTYENSQMVLDLPPLPLHVDVPAWLQLETVLDVLEGKNDYQDNHVFTSFNDRVQGLMVPNKAGALSRTGLDRILADRASEVAGEPELVLRTRHSPLLAFLDDNELKKRFLKLAAIGHLIWKGERVPEMVDHGLRHHNDLFLLAEKVLLPIFYYREDFLAPHELYTLLAALFLHDCGHVVGKIDDRPRPLLPTEVRDHHHVLGYLRLRDWDKHGGTGEWIYKALNKESNEDFRDTWRDFLQAPATIGLYHRKKMLMTGPSFKYDFFKQKGRYLQSLNAHLDLETEKSLKVNGDLIGYDRAALLISLLRIIDGLDEQVSRTGGVQDVAFHLALLDTEIAELKHRTENWEQIIKGILTDKEQQWQEIETAIAQRLFDFIENEGKGGEQDAQIRELANSKRLSPGDFDKKIGTILSQIENPAIGPLIREYISQRIHTYFKEFQKHPYGEKVFIEKIIVKHLPPNNGEGQVEILVDLRMHKEEIVKRFIDEAGCRAEIEIGNDKFDMRCGSDREQYGVLMLGELKKEYLAEDRLVEKILNENGVIIQYGQE